MHHYSDLVLQSITYSVVFPKLDTLDKENKVLKSDLVAAESKIESLEEFSEETVNTLYINALEISSLKDKNELLTLQNTIFDSSIKAIEARLHILEEHSGIGSKNFIIYSRPESGVLMSTTITHF